MIFKILHIDFGATSIVLVFFLLHKQNRENGKHICYPLVSLFLVGRGFCLKIRL